MPDLAEDSRINVWRDRIERSKKIRKKYLKDVKKYIEFYEGSQWGDKKVTLSEKAVVNLIFPHIKAQLPALYFQNPKWFCNAKGKKDEIEVLKRKALIAQEALNYYAKENLGITLKKQIRLSILDAFFSFGTIKVGYVADFESNPTYGNFNVIGYDEGGDPIYEIDPETGKPLSDDEEEIVTNEAFFARRRSPRVMLFDPECENYFEDGRWIAEEIVKTIEDVKASRLYDNTKDLEASFSVKPGYGTDDIDHEEYPELREDLERITIYEMYDLEHDKLLVMADGHDKFLRDETTPDGVEGCPYVFLRFNETPDEMYPISDIKNLKPVQEEYNLGRSMIMTHAKRYARKYGYTDSTFGSNAEQEMEKVKNPEDGLFFKVQDLKEMPQPLVDAPLDAAVYSSFEQAKQDFREVGGATESERGVVERRKTAYEASKIAEASSIRKEDRKSLVEDFASEIGSKLLQSMQANLTIEEAVEIMGQSGVEWVNISREEIEGQFTVGVEIGSCAPRIPEFERQEMINMMQVIAQFPPDLVTMYINLEGILKNMPRYFPLLEYENLINTPEQVEQMKQMIMAQKSKPQQGGGQ